MRASIDASGRWVTPGLIDVHSHLGVYPSPGVNAHGDGNEATDPVTANVWSEHGVWPQDPGFQTALEGGITSLQILPGSANLIGGRAVTLKNVPATNYQAMKFPDAPQGLKMACGENPKRVYGGLGARAEHAHGQRRGLSPGVRRRAGLPRAMAQVRPRRSRSIRRRAPRRQDKKDSEEAQRAAGRRRSAISSSKRWSAR